MNSKAAGTADYSDLPVNKSVPAPVVVKPQGDVNNPVEFSGTGLAGWRVWIMEVPIDGDPFASALVGPDGTWSVKATLPKAEYQAFAVQMDNRERSEWSPFFKFKVN
ncbi:MULTISPECIES: hypothetical protein [Pseudomonas]|uniref:Uncharacterized protein n=1 Tax=Pseudomonas fluorescens TaxID=294 RepID=A0A7Z3C0H8_PSEFL|nr:hypothetical protein [Pseudomonas fluorescens]QJP93218.1 hypothetical protein C6Y56_00985 [Pseudomonas fluorescens]